jgi:hypothetical protein
LLEEIAPGIVGHGHCDDARDPEQGKQGKDAGERDGAGPSGTRRLHRQSSQDLDGSNQIRQNLAVGCLPERIDLLPAVEVMPNQGDDPKKDRRDAQHPMSETEFIHAASILRCDWLKG